MHSARHLAKDFCYKRKPFRRIATHYDKTQRNFLAGIHPVALAISIN